MSDLPLNVNDSDAASEQAKRVDRYCRPLVSGNAMSAP
jgi:hypothetical protein